MHSHRVPQPPAHLTHLRRRAARLGLAPRHVLHTRTSLGRAARTAYRVLLSPQVEAQRQDGAYQLPNRQGIPNGQRVADVAQGELL